MTTFNDRTFCADSGCCVADCADRLTDTLYAEAKAWWGRGTPPIAYADLWRECDRKVEE